MGHHSQEPNAVEYELAIIGGGIAGCMLAAAMARNGVKVLVLEAGTYPKFAIGESMILETSEIMRSLALVFDVPELEYFSAEHFMPVIGGSHGVKRHFSYLPHQKGKEFNADDVIQAVIPERPYGHELHIYRQDSDYFYVGVATKYGATVLQNTPVSDIDISDDGVKLHTPSGKSFNVGYVVDAGGYRSLIAQKKSLRCTDLQTHTRGIFTHMRGVRSLHDDAVSKEKMEIPFSLAEGTLHHVFDGGWLWVIPFNNHKFSHSDLCSVGLLLDPRVHGETPNIPPEEEFQNFVAQFPGIDKHLKGAQSVRNWVRADRLQYSSTEIVGDRFCLLGHAAGFIDPLFSKGLYTSFAAVLSFGRNYLMAREEKDFSRERFLEVEAQTLKYIQSNDRLVANAIKCFAHADLWRVYSIIWIVGAYLELVRLTVYRQSLLKHCDGAQARIKYDMPELRLVGGGFDAFDKLAKEIDEQIEQLDLTDDQAVRTAISTIRDRILSEKWIPYGHRAIAKGAKHLPKKKFSWKLFMNEGGILGRPDFKKHFFGDTNLFALGMFMIKNRIRYSRAFISRRHRLMRGRSI